MSTQEKVLELLKIEQEGNEKATGLRVKVIGGGCSGLRYELGWDSPKEEDTVQSYNNGLSVYVDDKSALYLMKSTLTYHDTLKESGFKIDNPNAKNTCGCGESFG